MNRRTFVFKSSGLILSAWILPSFSLVFKDKMDRIGMGTVLFRNRFQQTKPEHVEHIQQELTLLDVPAFYKDRFGVKNVEFWSYHFDSLDQSYLEKLKGKLKASGSTLLNVQLDGPQDYNLAATDEEERMRSVAHAKNWMDAVAFLGSKAIRINPGSGNGSVEKSIQSMKEVNQYAKSKNLVLLTENHFGIEMDPDIHLRIIKEAGPKNVYTLPDFGNYPTETMYQSLEKILPYAYMVSAKAAAFNKDLEHVSYDFDRCVRLAEQKGFKGVYCVEQWSREDQNMDDEKVGDWLIEHVKRNI
jgi:sugar phosphate isomerase/epimerase